MKKFTMLLMILMASVVLVGSDKNADKAKCLEACKSNCQKSYTICMKDAKTDGKKTACKQSLDLCNSVCVNQACR